MEHDDLAGCLRSWRDRLSPAAVGLPTQALRRAPGLRREELAQLSGLSVDYLTRLEQGRASHPSVQVLTSLARALRLGDEERDHLFQLAKQAPPAPDRIARHLTPGIQNLIDRLVDVPVTVVDASWEVIAWNALAAALLGEPSPRPGRDRNVLWRHFTGGRGRVVRDSEETAAFEADAVADLHAAVGRYPEDPVLRSLVADLREVSERFAALWETRPVATLSSSAKTFVHPEVGRITLDCDVLRAQGSDVRIIIYTPRPGSPDADALALVGVIGLQSMAPEPASDSRRRDDA
jgi:transcriptional regulator with XRE-family HTH domain